MADDSIAVALAQAANAAARPTFELQFNQIQNTLIRRLNDEIDDVNQAGSSDQRRLDDINRQIGRLSETRPVLQEFRIATVNNQGNLEALGDEINAAITATGDDATVTADEITAFNAARDAIVSRIDRLYNLTNPDIVDGRIVQKLKEDRDSVAALELSDATRDAVRTSLASLQTEASVALTVVANTVQTTIDLELDTQGQVAQLQSEAVRLTEIDAVRRQTEIENLQARYANLLQAISISFETSATFAESLTETLSQPGPPAGSVVNILT